MKTLHKDRVCELWRDMVMNYRSLSNNFWKIILCPQATAEQVMLARAKYLEVRKSMYETQRELDKHKLLGFHSPRLEKDA